MTDGALIQALVARRHTLGLRQSDIARLVGVCRGTIAKFETMAIHKQSPTLHVINRYAEAVGMELHLEVA